jgi:hypothetical protein
MLVYKIVQMERHEKKSEKEDSFMNKNIILMILNSLLLPFATSAILTAMDDDFVMHNIAPNVPKFPRNAMPS